MKVRLIYPEISNLGEKAEVLSILDRLEENKITVNDSSYDFCILSGKIKDLNLGDISKLFLDIPIYAYGITLDGLDLNEKSKPIYSSIFKSFNSITVRDNESLVSLFDMGIKSTLTTCASASLKISPLMQYNHNKEIVIFPRHKTEGFSFEEKQVEYFGKRFKDCPEKIYLVPFSETDISLCEYIRDAIGSESKIYQTDNPREIVWLISQMKQVITSSYHHPLLWAYINGKPYENVLDNSTECSNLVSYLNKNPRDRILTLSELNRTMFEDFLEDNFNILKDISPKPIVDNFGRKGFKYYINNELYVDFVPLPDFSPETYYDEKYFLYPSNKGGYGGTLKWDNETRVWWEKHAANLISETLCETSLDIGCGMGQLVHGLKINGINAWGLDISDFCVKNSWGESKNRILLGNISSKLSDWYIKDMIDVSKFDLTTAYEVFEHIPKDKIDIALDNFASLTKIGGYSHISVPDSRGILAFHHDPTHVLGRPESWWKKEFDKRGFKIIENNWTYCLNNDLRLLMKKVNENE